MNILWILLIQKKYLNWFPSYDMYYALLDMRKILENEMGGYDL